MKRKIDHVVVNRNEKKRSQHNPSIPANTPTAPLAASTNPGKTPK
jgi:hypothetical protein